MPMDDHGPTPFVLQPRNTMIGAEISEIDLRKPLDDSIFDALAAAFDRYSVVVFRNQNLTPEQRIVFSRRFGPLQINVRSEFNKSGYPEIYRSGGGRRRAELAYPPSQDAKNGIAVAYSHLGTLVQLVAIGRTVALKDYIWRGVLRTTSLWLKITTT